MVLCMDTSSVVRLSNVSYSFLCGEESIPILKRCSLEIKANQHTAIIGQSGAGKTTLLKLMAGMLMPDEGDIYLLGNLTKTLNQEKKIDMRRNAISFIFQDFRLIACLSALDNVMLPGKIRSEKDTKRIALDALEQVGMSHRLSHFPYQLSGGEQQRVAIARSIAQSPQILFADEPTGNVDEKKSQDILNHLFTGLCKTTIVLVTHDQNSAQRCDNVYRLHEGQCRNA